MFKLNITMSACDPNLMQLKRICSFFIIIQMLNKTKPYRQSSLLLL